MPDQPIAQSQAHQGVGTEPVTRVGILTGSDGTLGTASLLLEVAGVTAVEAKSVADLQALVRDHAIAAVVVDPELGDGWSVDTAEKIAGAIGPHLPILLLCRHAHDAQIIEQRVAAPTVTVLLYDNLTSAQLSAILNGAIAAHLARPGAAAPS